MRFDLVQYYVTYSYLVNPKFQGRSDRGSCGALQEAVASSHEFIEQYQTLFLLSVHFDLFNRDTMAVEFKPDMMERHLPHEGLQHFIHSVS
jgi:hypothetical protein